MEERLGVAGGGAIASGLAATAAVHGPVVMLCRSEASAERTRALAGKQYAKLSGEENEGRITVTTDPAALADRTFVVEAIAEEYDAKEPLLRQLGELLPEDAIVGTTTSSLSIERLAPSSGRPERFVGLHVFNPVTRMKLVELAFPAAASDATRARALKLCHQLEKTAVEVPDVPGFVVNRLLFPYLFSAVTLLEETGLEPDEIDTCMTLGAAHPLGPLALLDFVGLDVSVAIAEAIGTEVPQKVRDLIAEGALGKKTKRGFYTY